jgi:hypothetical protein
VVQKASVWVPVKEDVESVDWQGRDITLKNVPAELNQEKGTVRVRLDDILKAEQEYIAREHGLAPQHIHLLSLLYVAPRFIKSGYIEQKFRFNKMLFYLWKEMEKRGYGNSYIYDEFASARAGPVPKHLKEHLAELEKKGIVRVKWAKKPGESLRCELTNFGKKIAKSIRDNTPDDIKKIALKTKEELFLIDATQLKEKVHKDYPEYKKTYIELDTE